MADLTPEESAALKKQLLAAGIGLPPPPPPVNGAAGGGMGPLTLAALGKMKAMDEAGANAAAGGGASGPYVPTPMDILDAQNAKGGVLPLEGSPTTAGGLPAAPPIPGGGTGTPVPVLGNLGLPQGKTLAEATAQAKKGTDLAGLVGAGPQPKPPTTIGDKDKLAYAAMQKLMMAKGDLGFGAKGGGGAGGGAPKSMFTPGEEAYQKDLAAHMKAETDANGAIVDAQTAGDLSLAVKARNFAESNEADLEVMAKNEERRQAETRSLVEEYQAKADKLSTMQVDPERFYKEQSTGDKVLSVIGVALMGFAGNVQAGLQTIQKKVDADIEAQKANIATGYKGLEEQRGILGMHLAEMGDERAAEASAQMAYWKQVELETRSIVAGTNSEIAKANGQKLVEAAQWKQKEFADQITLTAEQRAKQLQAQQAAAAAMAASELKKQNAKLFDANIEVAKKKAGDDGYIGYDANNQPVAYDKDGKIIWKAGGGAGSITQVITGVNAKGEPIYATAQAGSKEQAAKFGSATETYASIKSGLAKLKELREAHGGGAVLSPEDQAIADQTAMDIKLQLKNAYELGAISKSDAEMLDALVPKDPLETKLVGLIGSDPIGKKLDNLESTIDAKYKASGVTAGLPPPKTLNLQKPVD